MSVLAKDITLRSDTPVKLIDHMGNDLTIARAAWENWERLPKSEQHLRGFLRSLAEEKHGSPFEFGGIIFHIECPLFVVAQAQRHRIGFSYAQRSARYRRMLAQFYSPDLERPLINLGTKMRPKFEDIDPELHARSVARDIRGCQYAWDLYCEALEDGEAEEIARRHLPVSTYTGFSEQLNPRSLMAFLELRTHEPEAAYLSYPQYEIEQVARKIEAYFASLWPKTYEAFEYARRVAP